MTTTLPHKIRSAFDKALASGHLIWTNSTLHRVPAAGIEFQVRLAPSLGKKPGGFPASNSNGINDPKTPTSKERPNPFLPFDPAMFVDALEHHNLLLNKFSIVAGHVLLCTKEFESQYNPLNARDLAAVWRVMNSPGMKRYICFYNCGDKSGASQPHKHLQLLPESDNDEGRPFPPISSILGQHKQKQAPGSPLAENNLPFAHSITFIPPIPFDASDAGDILESLYRRTLIKAFEAARLNPALCLDESKRDESKLSYNFVMDREFMMVVPRRAERAEGLSLNSVAFAGMVLTKSEEQLEIVKAVGPMKFLMGVTYPATE